LVAARSVVEPLVLTEMVVWYTPNPPIAYGFTRAADDD